MVYELSEKCSRAARIWFDHRIDKDDQDNYRMTNHYNVSQNRCFLFMEYERHVEKTPTHDEYLYRIQSLVDVNENNFIGTYVGTNVDAPTECRASVHFGA
jgi:hypothetical protein